MQYGFGVGILAFRQTGAAAPQPTRCGTLQNVSIDIDQEVVEMRGNKKFPDVIALGKGSLKGKFQFGQVGSGTIAAILGGTTTNGSKVGVIDEGPTTPTTNAITVSNAANFYEDLGVIDTTSGLAMLRMANGTSQASLTTNQYTVNEATGTYTFATADATHKMSPSYSYTRAAAGKNTTIPNGLMGAGSTFVLSLYNSFRSGYYGLRLGAIVLPKLSLGLKNDGFTMVDGEFSAQDDGTGIIGSFFSEE